MKRVIALLAVSISLAASIVAAPAEASCNTPGIIGSAASEGRSFIWTSGVFDPQYYAGYAPLSYGPDASPPVTENFAGSFWKLGLGDPVAGLGDDNGSYDFVNAGGFYYPAYPGYGGYYGYYSAGSIFALWFTPGVDGCIQANNCMCVLLTDQDGTNGYFAIASARSLATNDTFLNQGGTDGSGNEAPIILVPIPRPRIVAANRVPFPPFDVAITVVVDPPVTGIYAKDGCDCGPVRYKIHQQVLPRGTPPADDRLIILWNDIAPPQPAQLLGGSVSMTTTCGGDNDTYIAASLVFDSGFETPVVSANATRIECGPNLADPADRPRPDPRRIRPSAPTPRERNGSR